MTSSKMELKELTYHLKISSVEEIEKWLLDKMPDLKIKDGIIYFK